MATRFEDQHGWVVVLDGAEEEYSYTAISPQGVETIRVEMKLGGQGPTDPPWLYLSTYHTMWPTALHHFLTHEGQRYFSVLTPWGRRFSLNLTRGQLTFDELEGVAALEQEFAETTLRKQDYQDLGNLQLAIGLVWRRQLQHLVPLLQEMWRSRKADDYATMWVSPLLGKQVSAMEPLPTLRLVLAAMGVLEPGPACYHFESCPSPQGISDRSERLDGLEGTMWLNGLFDQVGCPDCIEYQLDGGQPTSEWHYYSLNPPRITTIEWEYTLGSDFVQSIRRQPLSDERVEELLWRMIT